MGNKHMFKVGDLVKVINWGMQYTRYKDWFKKNAVSLETDWIIRFPFDHSIPEISKEIKYRVLFVDINSDAPDKLLITDASDEYSRPVYLIDSTGCELIYTERPETNADKFCETFKKLYGVELWENGEELLEWLKAEYEKDN